VKPPYPVTTDTENKIGVDTPSSALRTAMISSTRLRRKPLVKFIQAIIRPEKLEAAKDALVAIGITGITVTSVNGFGKQLGHTEVYRGVKVEARLLPKAMLTILVADEKARDVMNTLREATMTGEIGDGKIVVLAVEEAMRIRTGETGEASIS
jgi:nitrogen regulatory protein PII